MIEAEERHEFERVPRMVETASGHRNLLAHSGQVAGLDGEGPDIDIVSVLAIRRGRPRSRRLSVSECMDHAEETRVALRDLTGQAHVLRGSGHFIQRRAQGGGTPRGGAGPTAA